MFCRNSSKLTLELYYLIEMIGILYLYFHYMFLVLSGFFHYICHLVGITPSSLPLPSFLCPVLFGFLSCPCNYSIYHLFLLIYETFSLHSTPIFCSNDAARKRWFRI